MLQTFVATSRAVWAHFLFKMGKRMKCEDMNPGGKTRCLFSSSPLVELILLPYCGKLKYTPFENSSSSLLQPQAKLIITG